MSKKMRKEAEVITISDEDTDANSDSELPGWLPDGWDRVSRWNDTQDVSFYYQCPMCVGTTLLTKDAVLRHCFFSCEDAPHQSQALFRNTQEQTTPGQVSNTSESPTVKDRQKSGPAEQGGQFGNGLFDSIPSGWIIEIRRSLSENGKNHKFYVEPTKKYRFSSKEEVQFYLKEGKPLYPASKEVVYCNTKVEQNMIAELTFSPKNLPYGWIKEMKYRQNCDTSKQRRDPYYTDPESGLVFRSLKEVNKYLITGEVPKQVKRTRSFADVYSFEGSSEVPKHLAGKFCTSIHTSGQSSKSPMDGDGDGEVEENGEEDLLRPTDGLLKTSEAFVKGGTEHECLTDVGTKVDSRNESNKGGEFYRSSRRSLN